MIVNKAFIKIDKIVIFMDTFSRSNWFQMRSELKENIIQICDEKMAQKGENVGLSFYAFFKNKNDNPERLMEVAHWWIIENKLDHFEKAYKVKQLIQNSSV